MISKERVRQALSFKTSDRVPCFYMATNEINQQLALRLFGTPADEEAILDYLDIDVRFVRPRLKAEHSDKSYFKVGDVHAKFHKEAGHENIVLEKAPLADIEDPAAIHEVDCWPDPDWFDYQIDRNHTERIRDRAVVARGMGAIFLYSMSLRGMEQILIDMALNPEMAEAIFTRITDTNCARIERLLASNPGLIDYVDIGDDVAGQSGMVFSIDMWLSFIKPQLQRMVDICKRYNTEVLFHGCGGFADLFEDMKEIGISGVGRLQSDAAGNDFDSLLSRFGGRISLWGGVDAQHRLISGSTVEVGRYVEKLKTAAQGGFVIGPTHTFTEDTPIENIIAMYTSITSVGV